MDAKISPLEKNKYLEQLRYNNEKSNSVFCTIFLQIKNEVVELKAMLLKKEKNEKVSEK